MTYEQFREIAVTGGVLGARGSGLIGMIIRIFTGSSIQHVALLIWIQGGLFVAEFVEGTGFQILPASQWFKKRKKQQIFYGKPPQIVQNAEKTVRKHIFEVRDTQNKFKTNYNYWELPLVWFANIFNRDINGLSGVCSSFVNHIYSHCGVSKRMQVPGDIFDICPETVTVTYDSN